MKAEPVTAVVLTCVAAALSGCADAGYAPQYKPDPVGKMAKAPPAEVRRFNRSVALASELKYAEALEGFEQVIEPFEQAGRTERTAEAMFWAGYCHEKLGRPAAAAAYYPRAAELHPTTAAASQAARRLRQMEGP